MYNQTERTPQAETFVTNMAFISVFALTFLCAIVPCEIKLDLPEVSIRREYFQENRLVNEYPLVRTGLGAMRGYSMASILGKRIHAFEGVRYGVSPVGDLRFKPPVASGSWTGVYSAFKPGPRCIQFHPGHVFQVIGKEDCLFLNIYSPNIPNPEEVKTHIRIPVVVWLHGGSFVFGAGHEYGPAYMTDQNLLLVTVNYRLGVYGFMSTGDSASPGNYGIKDQVLALKWVHENIHYFGGDPDRVTLMGQSAGGVSAHLHMISNQSRAYFRSAVSLSSSAFNQWAVQTTCQAKFWTNWLAELVKCPRINERGSQALVDCFRHHNPQFLVANTVRLLKWFIFPPVLFAPVVEIEHPGAFLTDTVPNHYRKGDVAKKPWINGITSEEGYLIIYFLQTFQQLKYFRRHFTELQAIALDYDQSIESDMQASVNRKIQQFYFGSSSPENVSLAKIDQVLTDRYFSNGIVTAIEAHSQIAPTFPYYFDYNGTSNAGKVLGRIESEWGVGHGEDVFYYLNSSIYYDGMRKTSTDFRVSQVMLNHLGNFVREGVPLYTERNGTSREIWAAQRPNDEVRFLRISRSVKMIRNPFRKRIDFWKTLRIPDVIPFSNEPYTHSCTV